MNYMRTLLSARFKASWKVMRIVGSTAERDISGCFSERLKGPITREVFGRTEDSRVTEASLVLYSLSHGEGIGGPDHTMGGQGAKRTDDRDFGADTSEAGACTGRQVWEGSWA